MQNQFFIKFCGITQVEDALLASQLGVTHLGFIFVPNTPRYIDPEKAKSIIQIVRSESKPTPQMVGVFQNESPDNIQKIYQELSLDLIQYHGKESTNFIKELALPCIKVLTIDSDLSFEVFNSNIFEYKNLPNTLLKAFLLDLPKNDPKPEPLNTRLTRIFKTQENLKLSLNNIPFLLAGKLSNEELPNILKNWQPKGIDVASAIEKAPGKKDPDKMRTLINTIHNIQ